MRGFRWWLYNAAFRVVGRTRLWPRLGPILWTAVLLVVLCAGSAWAIPVPFELMDAGPALTLGGGAQAYPVDATIKVIPYEFDGPIADANFGKMLENAGRYILANAGFDILIPSSLNAEDVAGGASLPIVNAKVSSVTARAGAAYVGGTGLRGFLRVPIVSEQGGLVGSGLARLTLMPVAERTDLLRQAETGTRLTDLIPGDGEPSLTVSYTGDSIMLIGAVPLA